MKRRIVLLGPPASGKGSQSQLIFKTLGIPAISTGHLLRNEALADTALGREASAYTSKGQLAPDELVMAVLRKWLGGGRSAYVFDGFPRTVTQAEHLRPLLLEEGIPLEIVLYLECDLSTTERRVFGRVTCSSCKTILQVGLHVLSYDSPCPVCGAALERRIDDDPKVLRQRMEQYFAKTAPLIDFYQSEGLLQKINANRDAADVFIEIKEALTR